MAISKVKKRNIGEEVYEQLEEAILSGDWPPGYKLPSETDLAEQMGVSRVTIRGALGRLSGLHLIERRQGDGTFVREISGAQIAEQILPLAAFGAKDLKNLMEFREIFESEVAALAAVRASDEEIEALRGNFRTHMKTVNMQRRAEYDMEFHVLLAKISGNALLAQIYETFRPMFAQCMQTIVDTMGNDEAQPYHSALIEAIAAHDPAKARSLMREHIHRTVDAVVPKDPDEPVDIL